PAGPGEPPSLEERCHEVSAGFHATHMPHRGADWGPMLTAAGFAVEGERTLTVSIDGSRDEAIGAYARSGLERLRLSHGEPLARLTNHLPAGLLDLPPDRLAGSGLYGLLREAGITLHSAR
ncbi:methyltransferase type 12, partial [Streptomyces sp. NRRL F-6602]